MSDEQPPGPTPRRKLEIEQPISFGRQGAAAVYGLAALVLAGVSLYMAVVEQRELTSAWVIAPAIGAVWFGLRLFMILGSGK